MTHAFRPDISSLAKLAIDWHRIELLREKSQRQPIKILVTCATMRVKTSPDENV
jgi:hypothetical protein